MMACSYLSAGGLKSEPTSAACWSPPAMAGCHAADTRSAPMTLPTPSLALPSGPMNLQIGPMGLHETIGLSRTSMTLPPGSKLPSNQMGLSSGAASIPTQPMGLPSGSELASRQSGQSSETSLLPGPLAGPMALPTTQIGLPSFARSMPLDFHKTLSQTGSSASEPALDLSTSASVMTSSLKSQLPTADKTAE